MDETNDGYAIEPQRGKPLQCKKAKKNGLTKARRKRFLETLAATCNVSMAIAASGKAGSSIYRKRRRDPEFAAEWQAALEIGYARLEAALVRRALAVVDGYAVADEPADAKIGEMTVAQAIDVMDKHRRSVEAGKAKTVRPNARRMPSAEDTDRAIMKRIAIIRRRRMEQQDANVPHDAGPCDA